MIRRASLLAAAALGALALAGCGGDGGEPEGPPPAQVVESGDPAQGEQVFAGNCAACHGGEGGGGTGPKLAGEAELTDPEQVVDQIREGGGGMPSFGDRLNEQELADVSAFVVEQLAAGR
jgi:mono/diheme cytochrome c family protein